MSDRTNIIDELRASAEKLANLAEEMMSDERYSTDDDYCIAANQLYERAMTLYKELGDANSKLLADTSLKLSILNDDLRSQLDKLHGVVAGVNTTAQVVQAIATVVTILGPLGL